MPETAKKIWSIPYIDQPLSFWSRLNETYGEHIKEVFLPLPRDVLASGRPVQPRKFQEEFIKNSPFNLNILINPVILNNPVEDISIKVIDHIKFLTKKYKVSSITVSNITLARNLKNALPELKICASALMDIYSPYQLQFIEEIADTIVPSSRIMRDIKSLANLRKAWKKNIKLIVNEGCLPGCPLRTQHFYEMTTDLAFPKSLCSDILKKDPWLRLTGSWVLPQHLHLFKGLFDELKLSGRVGLQNPEKYFKVLGSYINGSEMLPNEIGGGPASILKPLRIDEKFYKETLVCSRNCEECKICKDYYFSN